MITRDKKLTVIEKSKNKGLVVEYFLLNDFYLEGIYVISICLGLLYILYMWIYFFCKNLIF